MRAVNRTIYVAEDGSEHLTAEAAEAHERALARRSPAIVLENRSADEFRAAIDGNNPFIGDAVENLARMIAKARLERGERKRRAPAASPATPEPEPVAVEVAEDVGAWTPPPPDEEPFAVRDEPVAVSTEPAEEVRP